MNEWDTYARMIDNLEIEKEKMYKQIASLESAIDEINWRLDEIKMEMELVNT